MPFVFHDGSANLLDLGSAGQATEDDDGDDDEHRRGHWKAAAIFALP